MAPRTSEVFIEGLWFGEGPRWRDGKLWFSDFFDHAVKSVDLDGEVEIMVELNDQPSGLGWLPDGHLLIVAMHSRRVLRMEAEGLVEHADLSAIAGFHCNDMVVDGRGRAYVGNFGFDFHGALDSRGPASVFAEHETATLALVDPDGTVRAAADELHFPNGTVITPDGQTLIIAESLARRLTAFDVAADGSLSNRRTFADLGAVAPDGICLDADGNVWVANAIAPECLLVASGGEVLDRVATTRPCYACMLGGDDRRTLFMVTAFESGEEPPATRNGLIEVATATTPGAGLP